MLATLIFTGCHKTPPPVALAPPPPPDFRPAISNVFFLRLTCLSNAITIAPVTVADRASAGLLQIGAALNHQHSDGRIAPRIDSRATLRKFSESLAAVDTSLCPDDFKSCWKDYVISTSISDSPTLSDASEFAAAAFTVSPPAALALAAIKTAGKEDQISAQKEKAFLCLKLSAAAYGVTNFSHLIFRLPDTHPTQSPSAQRP